VIEQQVNIFATGDFWGGFFGGGGEFKFLIFMGNNHVAVDGLANGNGGVLQAAPTRGLQLINLVIVRKF
jgi:hypothetical protein